MGQESAESRPRYFSCCGCWQRGPSAQRHRRAIPLIAEIEELAPDARKQEIGRMLSGEQVTPEALKHAEQLIRLAKE